MTNEQNRKCHAIIHSFAVAAAGGNAVPVPGLGCAVDTVAMTGMCTSLAAVFGQDIQKEVARGLAIAALKRTLLKRPIKVIARELSKLIPGLGMIVAPTISAGLVEAAGWSLINELENHALSTTVLPQFQGALT